jgi:hypothetical protein
MTEIAAYYSFCHAELVSASKKIPVQRSRFKLPAEQESSRCADSLNSTGNLFGVATRPKSGSKSFLGGLRIISCHLELKELDSLFRVSGRCE